MHTDHFIFDIKAFFSWQGSSKPLQRKWLHPCNINSTPYLIHHPRLAQSDPKYFHCLKAYAKRHNWVLRADRRTYKEGVRGVSRRKWLPTILLAFSLTSSPSMAQNVPINTSLKAINTSQSTPQLNTQSASNIPSAKPQVMPTGLQFEKLQIDSPIPLGYNQFWHSRIQTILLKHWQSPTTAPPNTEQDLKDMAAYFSRFPKVRDLFTLIDQKPWKLQYALKTFETQIHGNRLSVDSATVYFDPRSAAQFKFYRACTDKIPFCVASPADVLLHELLHVHSAINDSNTFISQGGMNGQIYPYEHERATIAEEKQLYQSMTRIDEQPRPLRSEHTGRHVLAACVTCLK